MNMQLPEVHRNRPEADTFDLARSWEYVKHAVIGHKVLIALCILLTTSIVLAYIIIWPPVYQSEVVVMAESTEDRPREGFYSGWNVFRTNNLQDEVELIKSRAVLERTATELGLTYDDVYHPFFSWAAHLWGESWVGKTYRKFKYMIFAKPCEPNCPTKEEEDWAKTLIDFREGVALVPTPDSYVGRVVVRASTPGVAVIANRLVEVFLEERKMRYVNEAEKSYAALKTEVEKAKADVLAFEREMEQYYTEENLLLEFEKDKVEVTQWLEMKGQITDSEAILASMEQSLASIDAQIAGEERSVVGGRVFSQNSRKVDLQNQLIQLKVALNQTKIRYTPDSPEVNEIEQQIAAVMDLIEQEKESEETQVTHILSDTYESLRQGRGELLTQIAGIKAGLAVKRAAEKELGARVGEIPEKVKVTHALGREHSILQKKYFALRDKLMIAAVSKATIESAPAAMNIVDRAIPPTKPTWPKTKVFLLLAVVMGAFIGIILGLLFDLIFKRINRYYLVNEGFEESLFAIIRRDSEFLGRAFTLPPPPKPSFLEQLIR